MWHDPRMLVTPAESAIAVVINLRARRGSDAVLRHCRELLPGARVIASRTADEAFAFLRSAQPQVWGAEIFAIGLWIALPLVAMLLFVNFVLGIVSRVAQQMNVFAIGFPISLAVGLVGMLLTLPLMGTPFTMALERMLEYFR